MSGDRGGRIADHTHGDGIVVSTSIRASGVSAQHCEGIVARAYSGATSAAGASA